MGWSRFFRRGRWDEERRRELQAYVDIETDENIARGMSAEQARYAARRKLGNPTLIREEIYVLPSDFWFPQPADVLLPLRPSGSLDDRGANTQIVARLKDGVTLRQAQAEMATVSENLRRAHASGESTRYRGLTVTSFHDWLVGDVRSNVWLLFGATGLLLLIACSNLGTLLLTRLAARGKEFALRLALGSSRRRLLSQFLTTLGLGLGLAGALLLTGWLSSLLYGVGPRDPWSFAAISLLLLVVGLAASFIPAYRATRIDPMAVLRCE